MRRPQKGIGGVALIALVGLGTGCPSQNAMEHPFTGPAGSPAPSKGTTATAPIGPVGRPGPAESTASQVWNAVIKPCVADETLKPDKMVYLGPSSSLGVGTIWRRDEKGKYQLKTLPPEFQKGLKVLDRGSWFTCSGSTPHSLVVDAGANIVLPRIANASGGASVDLNRARNVIVEAKTIRVVQLVGDTFSSWVDGLPANDPYKIALLKQDRLVAYRAVEVKGMTATLKFDNLSKAEVQAKFEPGWSAVGNFDAKLKAEHKDDHTLQITAPEPFFIMVELGRYDPPSGEVRGGGITPLLIPEDAPLSVELEGR
jgi:hypothetical protein